MSHILLKGWHRYKERGKYSWKSSLVIALVATLLLWWLPIFGPMVSGYVSGRTSGSKYKGRRTISAATTAKWNLTKTLSVVCVTLV